MVSILIHMGQSNLKQSITGYLSPVDFESDLKIELGLLGLTIISQHDRLFLCEGEAQDVVFAQDTWLNVEILAYTSINHAAELLKARASRYQHYSLKNHRRGELILEKVPRVKIKKFDFLEPIPKTKLGAFALLSESEIIVSSETTCPLPFGEIHFNEDKINPPSRAYLKLWELFTLYGHKPKEGMKTIDVGSCPGGWTWVLQSVGAHVVSVDKAPLDPKIAALPNIEFKQESAFGLRPQSQLRFCRRFFWTCPHDLARSKNDWSRLNSTCKFWNKLRASCQLLNAEAYLVASCGYGAWITHYFLGEV